MTTLNVSQIERFATTLAILLSAKLFLKSSFSVLKLDIFKFYACNKLYIKVAAVSNDIKVAYFSKIDFEGNLFDENCAHLLSIYPLQSQQSPK